MSRKNIAAPEVGNYFEGSSDGVVSTPMALIIDGTSLVYILDNELEEEVCADRS
jgi:phospholipid-transporting ATPase